MEFVQFLLERRNEREVAADGGSAHAEGWKEEDVKSVSCRSMRKVAGSCVGGIVVSIAAFQAVDPGSIPGQRSLHFGFWNPQSPELDDCDL